MKIIHSILAFNADDDLVHEVIIPASEVATVREFLKVPPWDLSPGDYEIEDADAKTMCRAYGSPFEIDGLSWFFGAFKEHEDVLKI